MQGNVLVVQCGAVQQDGGILAASGDDKLVHDAALDIHEPVLRFLADEGVVHRADVAAVELAHGGDEAAFQCRGRGDTAAVRDAAEEQCVKARGKGHAAIPHNGDDPVQVVAVVALLLVGELLGDVKGEAAGEVIIVDGSVFPAAYGQVDVTVYGSWQNHAAVVVDVLPDDVDAGRSRKELNGLAGISIQFFELLFQLHFQGGNILCGQLVQQRVVHRFSL